MFGNVTRLETSHISDTRTDNSRVEVIINVSSMLPAPETGMFYSPSGRIKEDVLNDMLEGVSGDVVGWYHYRQNSSLKPTMRDKVVSRALQHHFAASKARYFLCCNITSRQTSTNSTHTYSYRFYKVNVGGEMETLNDMTSNLGENVAGYKRTTEGDKNDPFNKAVMEARKDGTRGVSESVRLTIRKAAADSAIWEAKAREVETDINSMLAMLANHHQVRHSRVNRAAVRQEEQAVIQPLIEALSIPAAKQSEPFDFVTDIINNLKQNDGVGSPGPHSGLPLRDGIADKSKDPKAYSNSPGHKRIHSEGAVQSSASLSVCHNCLKYLIHY